MSDKGCSNYDACIAKLCCLLIIRLPEKFLSFHKAIIDEQQFLFYIISLN